MSESVAHPPALGATRLSAHEESAGAERRLPAECPPLSHGRRSSITQVHVFSAFFWTALFCLHTAQLTLAGRYTDLRSTLWRLVFAAVGFAMCFPLGWIVRQTLSWPFARKLSVLALVCLPLATAYAALGHFIWSVILESRETTTPALIDIGIQSLYNLILFLMWSGFCAAMLYAQELQERERSLLEARSLAHEAELKMLRYQINPHFLFNTLNAVSALVVTGQTRAADEMIGKLARFFRNALSRESNAKVTLAEEIRVQSEYLDIELTRFGDRLSFSTELDYGLEQALVPHLILQPLIENAIKHGVARMRTTVGIRVRAARSAGQLIVRVENDMSAALVAPDSTSGSGVGLANVGRRLESFYGPNGRLAISNRPGSFAVELRMPLELTL